MFLRNWYSAMGTFFSGVGMKGKNLDGGEFVIAYNTSNTSNMNAYNLAGMIKQFVGLKSSSMNSSGVVFGTGNVTPTLDDYKLSGDKVYGNLTGACSLSGAQDDSGITVTAVYTITNSDTKTFTISEIGLLGYGNGTMYMFERTVLDSPVTIAPNGVGQVSYTIRINYPT